MKRTLKVGEQGHVFPDAVLLPAGDGGGQEGHGAPAPRRSLGSHWVCLQHSTTTSFLGNRSCKLAAQPLPGSMASDTLIPLSEGRVVEDSMADDEEEMRRLRAAAGGASRVGGSGAAAFAADAAVSAPLN